MQGAEGGRRRSVRIVTELVVIVVGVLIALATDRWNQARSERASEGAYLERFVEEIRGDSARAEAYLQDRPSIIAGLDSLIAFVDGASPPPNLVLTLLTVSGELALPPVVAWTEIQATNSLAVMSDPDVRAALTTYYASRDRLQFQWRRQDSRARDPFWDQLYGTGIFDPKDELGAATTQNVEAFRSILGIRRSLLALGTGHYFQRSNAGSVLRQASAALRALRAAN